MKARKLAEIVIVLQAQEQAKTYQVPKNGISSNDTRASLTYTKSWLPISRQRAKNYLYYRRRFKTKLILSAIWHSLKEKISYRLI